MRHVYAIGSNIVSAIGETVCAHWHAALSGHTGIRRYEDHTLSNTPFMASKLAPAQWQEIQARQYANDLSLFGQLSAYSVTSALNGLEATIDIKQTAFILATTKGNIEMLGSVDDECVSLHHSAKLIAAQCGIGGKTWVISQACVSGVAALQFGLRLLQSGSYSNVVVTGCDRFSRFVLNGFQSFQAISAAPCRPFDAARNGITLGEAAATIILSVNKAGKTSAALISGATTNDANHISGPSRTGEELASAINRTLAAARIMPRDIGIISAHGTATIYNDEMEAKAFALAGLASCPVHSFKGYVGHTLGAAGVLESIMAIEAISHQALIPSAGFGTLGVPGPLNVTNAYQPAAIDYALKTASGFGGCNAAILWKKI